MYMAPEVLWRQPYNGLADVWSLGTLLFYLLNGRYPFNAKNIEELKNNVKLGDYSLPSNLSLECVSFLNCCLQIDIRKRCSLKDLV